MVIGQFKEEELPMKNSYSDSYKNSGVDVTAGYEAVKLMKQHVERTKIPGVVSDIGGFGGLFRPDITGYSDPVLVSGTDGVGTKIKIAQYLDKHDSIGIDCVAMCVNDVICCGAKPLFFLDYIACGKNNPKKIADIVKGVADGCVMSGCALIGGETAEHPGIMDEDDYDLAGFNVGIVDRSKVIDGSKVKAGDSVIGIRSSGVHSNGFSLVRKVFNINQKNINDKYDILDKPLGETLLTPTRIYVKAIENASNAAEIKGISHITGGGFYENMPRMLPDGFSLKIRKASVPVLPIFELIMKIGKISEHDMYNTFNMGIGMCLITDKTNTDKVIDAIKDSGETACYLGEVINGEEGVVLC
jgi:phosphoribosylformylglycinamidine cyclo-ligase